MPEFSITEIENREHIAPDKTGDNIAGKKTANYVWDGSNWQRQGAGIVPSGYDYMAYTNTSTTVDTYTFKAGGSAGATVSTLTITYTDTTKSTISSVARS